MRAAAGESGAAAAVEARHLERRRVTRYKKPITRQIVVEGVPLIVTLTDKALRFKVKRSRLQRYSLELSGLFRGAIAEAKKRHPTELPQESIDLRVPREQP